MVSYFKEMNDERRKPRALREINDKILIQCYFYWENFSIYTKKKKWKILLEYKGKDQSRKSQIEYKTNVGQKVTGQKVTLKMTMDKKSQSDIRRKSHKTKRHKRKRHREKMSQFIWKYWFFLKKFYMNFKIYSFC